jgi:hypothetical protein
MNMTFISRWFGISGLFRAQNPKTAVSFVPVSQIGRENALAHWPSLQRDPHAPLWHALTTAFTCYKLQYVKCPFIFGVAAKLVLFLTFGVDLGLCCVPFYYLYHTLLVCLFCYVSFGKQMRFLLCRFFVFRYKLLGNIDIL